jgi:hypothetical protein
MVVQVLVLVGARQFELWMLILTLTLLKKVEMDWSFYVSLFGHYVTFTHCLMGCNKPPRTVLQWKVVGQIVYRTKAFQKKKGGHHPSKMFWALISMSVQLLVNNIYEA